VFNKVVLGYFEDIHKKAGFVPASPLFVAATGGLDVDAIPNEITTRIILDSGKSSILAQAININGKGVK
jgi:hypothetical protein